MLQRHRGRCIVCVWHSLFARLLIINIRAPGRVIISSLFYRSKKNKTTTILFSTICYCYAKYSPRCDRMFVHSEHCQARVKNRDRGGIVCFFSKKCLSKTGLICTPLKLINSGLGNINLIMKSLESYQLKFKF